MNKLFFEGRIAAAPELRRHGETAVCKFTAIRNEYAGVDSAGEKRTRKVAVQFVAFGGLAETMAANLRTGDQVFIEASIRNNNYKDGDRDVYGFDFEIQDFSFGAPGAESRERLAARSAAGAGAG